VTTECLFFFDAMQLLPNRKAASKAGSVWTIGLVAFTVSATACYLTLGSGAGSNELFVAQKAVAHSHAMVTMRQPPYLTAAHELPHIAVQAETSNQAPAAAPSLSPFRGLMGLGGVFMAVTGLVNILRSKGPAPSPLERITVDLTLPDDMEDRSDIQRLGFGSYQGVSLFDVPERGLLTLYNRKKGLAGTLGGTSRKRARVSGFRARMATQGGQNVLRRRRAKGRKVLCPASVIGSKMHAGTK
jgi:large subunit ribosomal protein L34